MHCDVTKEADIAKAVEQVTKALEGSEHGLVGVLNCCGLGYTGKWWSDITMMFSVLLRVVQIRSR